MSTYDAALDPVYVAGPMSGYPDFNYPAFHAAAAQLRAAGYTVLNPAEGKVPEGSPYGDYIRSGLRMLLACRSIVLLPGWRASRGAVLEAQCAAAMGMPLCQLDDGVLTRAPHLKPPDRAAPAPTLVHRVS